MVIGVQSPEIQILQMVSSFSIIFNWFATYATTCMQDLFSGSKILSLQYLGTSKNSLTYFLAHDSFVAYSKYVITQLRHCGWGGLCALCSPTILLEVQHQIYQYICQMMS